MKTVGTRIQAARKLKKWKQVDLQNAVGKAISTIRNWERDKNRIDDGDLLLLSEVLGVSLPWLRDGVGEMRAPALRAVPREIGGVPVIDALKGGEQLYRMPLKFGGVTMAYVTVTITVEPGEGAGGVDLSGANADE